MSQVIQHFRELGLVFKRKGSSKENVINNDIIDHVNVGDEYSEMILIQVFLSRLISLIKIDEID